MPRLGFSDKTLAAIELFRGGEHRLHQLAKESGANPWSIAKALQREGLRMIGLGPRSGQMQRGRVACDKIVAFFVERHKAGDPPPTYEETMAMLDVSSTSSVSHHFKHLRNTGVLVKWGQHLRLCKQWIAENTERFSDG